MPCHPKHFQVHLSLVLWPILMGLLLLTLAACGPTPTPTLTPTSTNTPTSTATPTPTATPTVAFNQTGWRFTGSYVTAATPVLCAGIVSPGGFVLGIDASCQPVAERSSVVSRLEVMPADQDQLITLRIICPSDGCSNTESPHQAGARFDIVVDQQVLWEARCDEKGTCDQLALGEGPIVTIASKAPAEHEIIVSVSGGAPWNIADLQIQSQPMPTLLRGIAYSPFRDCQNPNWGPMPTESQIKEDLLLLKHMGNGIRTYASSGVYGRIPLIAQDLGLRVSAGASLGRNTEENEKEIAALIELAHNVPLESVIVGNEVLLRGDMSEEDLVQYVRRVKQAVDMPVTTAEIGSVLLNHPRLMDELEIYLVHLYPFWEGVPIENAARHVLDRYQEIQKQAQGKRVIIGETGWPAAGLTNGSAIPSQENQRRFLREFLTLAEQHNVEFYYFAPFDELWKNEGRVGPHWGIMYSDRRNKYDVQSMLVSLQDVVEPFVAITPIPTNTPGAIRAEGDTFAIYTDYAAVDNHFAPSGWMGDLDAIRFNDCASDGNPFQNTYIEASYVPTTTDQLNWAGIYWQEPENNWGTLPGGYDLRGFKQLQFRARGMPVGARLKFFVGGVMTGTYPSSIPTPILANGGDQNGWVTLSQDWQEYYVDLQQADLSHVIDGFGWVAEKTRTPGQVTLQLDNIHFSRTAPPTPTPTSTPTMTPTPRPTATPSPTPDFHCIYVGSTFCQGYDIGVDDGAERRDWVTDMKGSMRMAYPGGLGWGAVFITLGRPTDPPRPGKDLSAYQTLYVELKGENGGEFINIGIKDNTGADDGKERKIRVFNLTREWQPFTFSLSDFDTADVTQLYVMIEFVFEPDSPAQTVYFRNVKYLP